MQDDAAAVDGLVFVHQGSMAISTTTELCQAMLEITTSLLYPYIPPVFRIVECVCKVQALPVALSAATLACIEADVNVNAPKDTTEDAIQAQLHALSCMLGDAAIDLRSWKR
jgi:hypothetical protein